MRRGNYEKQRKTRSAVKNKANAAELPKFEKTLDNNGTLVGKLGELDCVLIPVKEAGWEITARFPMRYEYRRKQYVVVIVSPVSRENPSDDNDDFDEDNQDNYMKVGNTTWFIRDENPKDTTSNIVWDLDYAAIKDGIGDILHSCNNARHSITRVLGKIDRMLEIFPEQPADTISELCRMRWTIGKLEERLNPVSEMLTGHLFSFKAGLKDFVD